MLPREIKNFIDLVSRYPSIGPRQATRLAFYLIDSGKNEIENLEKVTAGLKLLKTCDRCFFVYLNSCPICFNPNRDKKTFAIVEKETDLISLEKTGKYRGQYLILGGLSKNGELKPSQQLRLKNLKTLIKKELTDGQAEEIIIALNPTTFGDFTASLLEQELKPFAKKISRLARGMPSGGEIEFADEETLSASLEKRN